MAWAWLASSSWPGRLRLRPRVPNGGHEAGQQIWRSRDCTQASLLLIAEHRTCGPREDRGPIFLGRMLARTVRHRRFLDNSPAARQGSTKELDDARCCRK